MKRPTLEQPWNNLALLAEKDRQETIARNRAETERLRTAAETLKDLRARQIEREECLTAFTLSLCACAVSLLMCALSVWFLAGGWLAWNVMIDLSCFCVGLVGAIRNARRVGAIRTETLAQIEREKERGTPCDR